MTRESIIRILGAIFVVFVVGRSCMPPRPPTTPPQKEVAAAPVPEPPKEVKTEPEDKEPPPPPPKPKKKAKKNVRKEIEAGFARLDARRKAMGNAHITCMWDDNVFRIKSERSGICWHSETLLIVRDEAKHDCLDETSTDVELRKFLQIIQQCEKANREHDQREYGQRLRSE